ncbi:DUF4123 domain-containing protein [uncultured Tateyamaria sp.]|uniref:DUF4123 domain-containing protein n=1 Tax=Tateyamaria sp. 1078 TaxID=3417464 RepID=UPI00261AF1A2|nr:DUF4123 domain-containing protein [uncultured Tateyamaria sp.]
MYLDISQDSFDLPLSTGPGVDKELGQRLEAVLFPDRATVFAILDGGRVPGLPEKLVAQGVLHVCLFSGDMAEDAGEAAPWLAQMQPDTPLLRQMFCDVPDDAAGVHGLMRAGAGIVIRSGLDMDTLRRHLRRFLRVEDSTGRTYFFRFWEPDAAAVYFRAIAPRADVAHRWMYPRDAAPLEAIVIPTWLDGVGLTQVCPGPVPDQTPELRGAFALAAEETDALRDLQWRRDKAQLAERLARTFPDAVDALADELPAVVSAMVDRMVGLGFWRRDMLFTFCAWAVHYGPDVLDSDPDGLIAAALARPDPVEDRFADVSARMKVLERDYLAREATLG